MINIFTKKTIAILILVGSVLIIGLVSSAQKISSKSTTITPVSSTVQASPVQSTAPTETPPSTSSVQTNNQGGSISRYCENIDNNITQILQKREEMVNAEADPEAYAAKYLGIPDLYTGESLQNVPGLPAGIADNSAQIPWTPYQLEHLYDPEREYLVRQVGQIDEELAVCSNYNSAK